MTVSSALHRRLLLLLAAACGNAPAEPTDLPSPDGGTPFADGSHDARILGEESVAEMERLQVPDLEPSQALTWFYEDRTTGSLLGHDGGEQGIATLMMFRPTDGVGALVLANGDWNDTDAMDDVFDGLMQAADAL